MNPNIFLVVAAFFAFLWLWINGKRNIVHPEIIGYHFCGRCGYITEFNQFDNRDFYNCSSCGFENIVLKIWPSEEAILSSYVYVEASFYNKFGSFSDRDEALEEEEVLVTILDEEEIE